MSITFRPMHPLVAQIRQHGSFQVQNGGELLAVAALMRCAHLLEAMNDRLADEADDPLTALGFRDVIETAINGLVCVTRPEEAGRFLKDDIAARRRIAKALDATEEFEGSAVADEYGEFAEGPGQMTFAQRVDLLVRARPELFTSPTQPGLIKAMYGHLCNFSMHGGAGVLGDYLEMDEVCWRSAKTGFQDQRKLGSRVGVSLGG